MQGRTAVVTGATGFIGSNLVPKLIELGFQTHVVVRLESSFERLPLFKTDVKAYVDDGSTADLIEWVRDLNPSVCFHLATHFVGVHKSDDIESLVNSNILFGSRIAEALSATENQPLMINVGTAWQHFDSRPYAPTSLYAATKQAFQDILQYYADSRLLRVANLKFFDTYGPGDPRKKLIPALIDAAESDKILEMSGGEQLIELIYIDDAVEALISTQDNAEASGEYWSNFAADPESPVSIRTVVETLEAIAGKEVPVLWGARENRPKEMFTKWHAGSRPPGWAPKVSLEEGLQRVWAARAV